MTAILRPARESDIAALVTLLRRSWLVTWAPEVPFSAVERFVALDPARQVAQRQWQALTVAELDGAVAGVLRIEENWIRSIELAPELRRRRIGTQLMDEAERRIRQGYPEARLEVRAFNVGAIEFYKRRGWMESGRHEGMECGAAVETIEMVKTF